MFCHCHVIAFEIFQSDSGHHRGCSQVDLENEGWRIREAYNFGMPRPGDATFARSFDQMSGSQFVFVFRCLFCVHFCYKCLENISFSITVDSVDVPERGRSTSFGLQVFSKIFPRTGLGA